jgi:hypothetical protein
LQAQIACGDPRRGAGLNLTGMTSTIHFERPSFDEIVAAIRRIFPLANGPEFGPAPDSICSYFEAGGVKLLWHRIPDWESYECGSRDISVEEFIGILFSPRRPASNENIFAVTDECIWEGSHRGFSFQFADLLPFARDVYPHLMSRPMDFFQPSDTIFVAEKSKLLVMLHHEGHRAQYAA